MTSTTMYIVHQYIMNVLSLLHYKYTSLPLSDEECLLFLIFDVRPRDLLNVHTF